MNMMSLRALLRSPVLPLLALTVAGLLAALHSPSDARDVLTVGLYVSGLPLVYRTVRQALRGQFAADVVASLAVIAAMALQQPLAGVVVVLMQTGGEALERYAEGRASEAVEALEREAPRRAHRCADNDSIVDIDVAEIRVGDRLLVRPGEMIPCDGTVVDGHAHVDTARITGEPAPVSAVPGVRLSSGCIDLDGALTLRSDATARESQYERIVELVRTAQASKAPFQRLADKYARWFTPLTLATCALTYLISRDATRVLSVLVVATPCPLLLAVPVAIIGGINRAARHLIVVRTGGALEQLSEVNTVVFDKTGTLTIGRPAVSHVSALAPFTEEEVLSLAAAVEVRSGHLLARSVAQHAASRDLATPMATQVIESPGQGIRGTVEGHTVHVGARSYVASALSGEHAWSGSSNEEGLRAFVAIDGRPAGTIEFADQLRGNIPRLLDDLGVLGVRHGLILSGDSAAHTTAIGKALGIDDARGDLRPDDKVNAIRELETSGARVLMVGDGTNDAPALSAATVGLALAAHGAGISAEAADVVLLTDDLGAVRDAIAIGQHTMHIARQSVVIGLTVSGLAMCFAAAGYIPPVAGAVLQEALDVAVILNALRSSRAPKATTMGRSAAA
jgi:heavy metal translocating P-type ATPase